MIINNVIDDTSGRQAEAAGPGFRIANNPVANAGSMWTPPMARDETYERLRQAILSGDLQPNERLVESDLVSTFAASRAAVRTAIVRLEQDRLVVHESNRGARVRSISLQEAVEIVQARAALEGLAARHAAAMATDADIDVLYAITEEMEKLHAQGDLLAMSDRNAALHRHILEVSGHETTQRLIAMLNSQMVRFQFRTILSPGRPERSLSEHQAVVAAIAAHDAAKSERAMRKHLDAVASALQRSVESSRGAA